jgi:hypothetical protein
MSSYSNLFQGMMATKGPKEPMLRRLGNDRLFSQEEIYLKAGLGQTIADKTSNFESLGIESVHSEIEET